MTDELTEPNFGVVSIEDIHDLAGVPQGADVHRYEWVDGGLKVDYEPRDDE
jgi:hypothetical protein